MNPSNGYTATDQIKPAIPELSRKLALRLRDALRGVVKYLGACPEPRDPWDDLGRRGAELRSLWLDKDVAMCRHALECAKAIGLDELAKTRHQVEILFTEKLAAALEGFDFGLGSPAALDDLLVDVAKENSDVIVAAARVQRCETTADLETLRTQALEAKRANERVIGRTSMRLAGVR